MAFRLLLLALLCALMAGCDSNKKDRSDTLLFIQIFPAPASTSASSDLSLAVGDTQQFIALGRFSDGSAVDITNSVVWRSSDTSTVTIDSSGNATAVAPGSAGIFARRDGVLSNRVTVNVASVLLTSIQVTPPIVSLAPGTSQQLAALGRFSDGSTADITDSVTWQSSDTDTVTVDADGNATAVAAGTASITASRDGITSNTVAVTVTSALLTSIQVTPAVVSLPKGISQQLTAVGSFSDGSTFDITSSASWNSDNAAVATVDSLGRVTAVEVGSANITASQDGITSNTATVTVTSAALTSIQVTPAVSSLPKGNSEQLTAVGTFSDGSTLDITSSASWNSDNTAVATVDSLGEVTAVDVGSANITASQSGITSNTATVTVTSAVLTSIQVTPAVSSLPKGNSEQLTAVGTFSDGSTLDITSSASWNSDNTTVATVDSLGEVTAVEVGSADITASQDGITSNTTTVTVTSAVLTSIQITPAVVSLPKGNSQQLTAEGTFSDGSNLDITNTVNWNSDNTAAATVDILGEVTAVDVGSANITASQGGISSNTATVTVTSAVLTSIQVTPAVSSLPKGNSEQLTAVGTFSDGSTLDITSSASWNSDNTAVATVDILGEVTGVEVGSANITASQDGITSNTAAVTVTSAVLTSIQVTPAVVSLPKGNSVQLTAVGTFSDGSTLDITSSASWNSDNTAAATVDLLGEVTAVEVGSADITASQDGITSNTATVTVTSAVLTSIQVTPATVSLPKGNSEQLAAEGTFSDGSTLDITNTVNWNSDNTAVATVDVLGEVTAVEVGSANITANQDGVFSNAVGVTVTSAVLVSIQVTPAAANLPKGNSEQLAAEGTFSDGSTLDITNTASWNSDNTAVATVDLLGEVTAVELGRANITASQDGITSNAVAVIVTSAVLTNIQVTPAPVSLPKGDTQQLAAEGTFSDASTLDITNTVSWNSDDTAVATVDLLGELTAVEVGSADITASQDGITSNTVAVTVTAAVTLCNVPSFQGTQLDIDGNLVTKTFYCAPTRAQVEATGTYATLESFFEGGVEFAKLGVDDLIQYCRDAFGDLIPITDFVSFLNANTTAQFGAPPSSWPVSEDYFTVNDMPEYVPITLTNAGGATAGTPIPLSDVTIRAVPLCVTQP
ncbi:beta strand repeat-containing protein [Microbulbifer sp. TYP-18]|uniref:beta strand repeat-containing protein n=1 Tax=Microbulbifer sp. TYP-18 TaxID=3230024 RepID=UPI0034C64EFA